MKALVGPPRSQRDPARNQADPSPQRKVRSQQRLSARLRRSRHPPGPLCARRSALISAAVTGQLDQHLGLQLSHHGPQRLDRHAEQPVHHQLRWFAQAIAWRGGHRNPHQRGLDQGAGDRTQRDAGMGLQPAVGLHHHRWPWLAERHPSAGDAHHRSSTQARFQRCRSFCHAVQSLQSGTCSLQFGASSSARSCDWRRASPSSPWRSRYWLIASRMQALRLLPS
jgi:hypothetical protein